MTGKRLHPAQPAGTELLDPIFWHALQPTTQADVQTFEMAGGTFDDLNAAGEGHTFDGPDSWNSQADAPLEAWVWVEDWAALSIDKSKAIFHAQHSGAWLLWWARKPQSVRHIELGLQSSNPAKITAEITKALDHSATDIEFKIGTGAWQGLERITGTSWAPAHAFPPDSVVHVRARSVTAGTELLSPWVEASHTITTLLGENTVPLIWGTEVAHGLTETRVGGHLSGGSGDHLEMSWRVGSGAWSSFTGVAPLTHHWLGYYTRGVDVHIRGRSIGAGRAPSPYVYATYHAGSAAAKPTIPRPSIKWVRAGTHAVQLQWQYGTPPAGAVTFQLEVLSSSGALVKRYTLARAATTQVFTGSPDVRYQARVRTRVGSSYSAWSATTRFAMGHDKLTGTRQIPKTRTDHTTGPWHASQTAPASGMLRGQILGPVVPSGVKVTSMNVALHSSIAPINTRIRLMYVASAGALYPIHGQPSPWNERNIVFTQTKPGQGGIKIDGIGWSTHRTSGNRLFGTVELVGTITTSKVVHYTVAQAYVVHNAANPKGW